MLADFGLSKYSAEIKSNSIILGMPAYIEPQCFKNNNHKRNEKSDIYGLGVLFWEISSGKPPFSEISVYKISLDIVNGIRETPIDNTPIEYQQLYEKCWKEDPNQRPDIGEIHRILVQLNKLILIIQSWLLIL
jgi:serine/threonine protein kinase